MNRALQRDWLWLHPNRATWDSLEMALGPFPGSVLLFCRLISFHGLISVVCLHDIYLLNELRSFNSLILLLATEWIHVVKF